MATQTLDALGDRVENLAEAIRGQGRVLAMMLGHQKLHNEMLAKVLEAVTRPPDDDDVLGGTLSQLVKQLAEQGEVIGQIHERVSLE